MKMSKKKLITTGTAVILAGAVFIGGGTYSYLSQTTDDIKNNFNAGIVQVQLEEKTGQEYNIIPGTTQAKDPKVTVNNTVNCYVFVKVTDTTAGLVGYEIADGWTQLGGYDDVYYREVEANATVKEFSVLKGDKVSYASTLENDDMVDDNGDVKTGLNLTFKASAIQKDDTTFNNPVYAYRVATASNVSNASDLKNALTDETVTYVISNGDIDLFSNPNKDIQVNGKNKIWELNGVIDCTNPITHPLVVNYSSIVINDGELTVKSNINIKKVSQASADEKIIVFRLAAGTTLIIERPNGPTLQAQNSGETAKTYFFALSD